MKLQFWQAILAAVAFALLSACSSTTPASDADHVGLHDDCLSRFQGTPGDGPSITLVVDRTGQAEPFQLPHELESALVDAAAQDGAISILAVDGGPGRWVVQNGSLMSEDIVDLSTVRAANVASQAGACVAALAGDALPTVAGSDIVAAVQVAAAAIPRSVRASGSATVVLVSDGLANAGALKLQELPVGDVDPRAISDALSRAGQLPDLAEVRFRMSGVGGSLSGPLNQATSLWLVDMWTAICEGSLAAECTVTASAGTVAASGEAEAPPDVPDDPLVPVPAVTAIALDGNSCQFTIPASLTFSANSAELLPGAIEALRPLVDAMLNSPDSTASLVGHTASIGNNVALSQARADEILRAMVSAGIETSRLSASGVGSTAPLVDDLDSDGNLIEAAAALNRVVVVVVTGTNGC